MKDSFLNPLFKQFHLKIHNPKLYEQAFTHSSMNINEEVTKDYQRLEFLGDSVLGSIVAVIAFKKRPDLKEGGLTKLRSHLVDTKGLSKLAIKYNFANYIQVGQSFQSSIKQSSKVLEDVFEAFIGAMYLDLGYEFTYRFVDHIFHQGIIDFNMEDVEDYKSRLQEKVQLDPHNKIEYVLIERSGPANEPTFKVALNYDGMRLGVGIGHSKKEAEQKAAKEALEKLAIKN